MKIKYTAFDGTTFRTKKAKKDFERETLLRIFDIGKVCAWICSCGKYRRRSEKCKGTLQDMEECFKLKLEIYIPEMVMLT